MPNIGEHDLDKRPTALYHRMANYKGHGKLEKPPARDLSQTDRLWCGCGWILIPAFTPNSGHLSRFERTYCDIGSNSGAFTDWHAMGCIPIDDNLPEGWNKFHWTTNLTSVALTFWNLYHIFHVHSLQQGPDKLDLAVLS